MKRAEFIHQLSILGLLPFTMKIHELMKFTGRFGATDEMPVLFVGHGNPMNAIENNAFTKGWQEMIKEIPLPKAILCISAHWQTKGTFVTAMNSPRTIHDFYGFPNELFQVEYPSPGAPEYAKEVQRLVSKTQVKEDHDWGLDHGTWSVLIKMYPEADIPVFQLSLDHSKPAQFHYDLARELSVLRSKGVLIIGSGNIVHNLGLADMSPGARPFDWALEFDDQVKTFLRKKQHRELIEYHTLGKAAALSIPTPEHYLPLLYSIAMQKEDELRFFNESIAFRSGSMTSVKIG